MTAAGGTGAQQQRMLHVLQQYWGYPGFRDPQEAVILNALAGNDSLVVMATGGGKSICYQVPPLVTGLPCVVVSPLIALMEDQVAALTARGVKAAMLGSAQSSAEVKRRAWAGEYQLIYITPELATNNTAALQQLHASKRIGLIAIDEAHCVSEWGHDFRPSYRNLGQLREALPGVPLMAVTATATQRVRQDIISQLGMSKASCSPLRQWVISFQRTNLQLSVTLKSGTSPGPNLAGLVAEAREAAAKGIRLDPTLIYAQTTREVDELAAHLQGKGVTAVKYHAKLPVRERSEAHRAFQHDDAAVMVASLAFGMGIDKPNIRRIIHYGIPASLESYYQQAGRAGRDGLQANCSLLWCPQDFVVQDMIKGASGLQGWNLESHTRGMAALRAYTSCGDCRHASLVNFFQPGTLPAEGPCTGGCDNCTRRAEAAEAAAAAAANGTQVMPGAAAGETDVTDLARLLVATVKALRSYGLNRSVSVLRGSKAKSVDPWMMELKGPDGKVLHGAGNSRSDDWWKGLAGVLMGHEFLQSQGKTNAQGTSYSVVTVTPKGLQLLSGRPAQLCLMLPRHLEAEETRKQQREAAERQRAAAREAAAQQRDEEAGERQQLLAELKEARKATADTLGQAPDVLVNDLTLKHLSELRPATADELQLVSGFGKAALQHFAAPLLQVLTRFCAASKHLKHNTDWHQVRRSRAAVQQLPSFGLTQQAGQFQASQFQAYGAAAAAGAAVIAGADGDFGAGFAAAQAAGLGGSSQAACAVSQALQMGLTSSGQAGSPSGLLADAGVYQGMLECKVLGEPKGAAQAAWDRWEAGETAEQVANEREKPIQVSTVLGYIAEAAAAAGNAPPGCPAAVLQRLQLEAGLAGSPAAEALLWRIVSVVNGQRASGLSGVKKALPEDVGYGQIKVVAAMLSLQAIPGAAVGSEGLQSLQELPTRQVHRGPAIDKLLPLPSSNAQRLYAKWRAGVPLAVVGTMDGLNMQLQAVLGALAEMAGAGYPADTQQLAAAAQLQEDGALAIAAAISSQGQAGIHAVTQALGPHVGYGQIKVVAALMALRDLWFSGEAVAARELAGMADVMADEDGDAGMVGGGRDGSSGQGQQGPSAAAAAGISSNVQQQQQAAGSAVQPAALTDASNLPLAAPVCAAAAAAAGQTTGGPPAAAGSSDAAAGDAAADSAAASAPVKRIRPSTFISNKSGKRRRPTAVAPPAPAAPAASTGSQLQQQQQVASTGMASPAPQLNSAAAAAAAMTTPPSATIVTQDAVLKQLWAGSATAPQLLKRLGVSGRDQEQQLQRVLQELVEAGEQVCITPEGSNISVHDPISKFIAF